MKKYFVKILPIFLLCALFVAAFVIGIFYYNFISQRIYEDSTNHLREIYGQVNRSFANYIERNWNILDDWSDFLSLEGDNEDTVNSFVAEKKQDWGFSEFYFLSKDKSAITVAGEPREFLLDGRWDSLLQGEKVMAGETLETGQEITVFAAPVENRTFSGFSYDGIAISYTNADLAKTLNADAYSGEAKCFVIHSDGTVLFSTREGGSAFANYLTYLRNAATDYRDSDLNDLIEDLQNNRSGLLQCKIGVDKVTHCILYLPVGYQDYFLISSVPQSAVSAGFLTVQKTTMYVFITIFLLIGVAVVTIVIIQSYKRSKKDRAELQYRELMFDVLSGTVDDIFIMLDALNQKVDYISPNVERLLGIPNELARSSIRELAKCAVNYNIVVPKEELGAIPLNGNRYWECEYMHQSTGERRWYRVTIYHMCIRGVDKYIIVMSDRTVEQQMNKQLKEALDAAKSANEAKSNFLSNMSHDIRTPMNAIVGFSVLLEKDADKEEKVREYTRKIMASGHHLLSLINDVLDMSKIESGKTSLNVDRFSLPELLEELSFIIMPQAKAKTQDFTIHVHGSPPEMMLGDKLRLNQILINLLSNAVKYTPNEGKIEFSVEEIPQSAPNFVKLRFVVKDNGIGMSEEYQKIIFAPFSREINSVTNKIQGTGLGMAITKNLVDLMGGIIGVESAPGKGSTFTVEMSFALPEPEEEESWYRHKITHMLVADDEEDICLNVREMMRDTGVDVSCVGSGEAAVEAAFHAHQNREDFDVILLDWKMPGMDGVETAREIRRKIGEHVPILVLTSYDWSEIETEAREAGINAFMPKPFFTSTFFSTIKPFFEEVEKELALPEADSSLKDKLFLVAEDNELNAEILTEMLHMDGAECEVAVNGKEAVEMFEKADPDRYDMILMDVQMPEMNGYEATRAIRASAHPRAKSIPIVAMTANTFAEDVKNALDSGMDGHLAKPIDMAAVRETVARLLNGKTERKQ